ncbi:MAG TPA: MBL fold metallo-hydrolase [Saprospiraceae bacterium]|nr:MBL fold metallo-hydrolase [Saprospiraceae bacterium]MCB9271895.1 MBL fold metallo-hydrolase [Lewinellaceae bacterium]HPG09421.1 MBL fold metallo-hydrolase [Saprospiraceae bacterium]HPR00858.1 MBL fold metallo-hydrolase [Saprospiraceae bacterium]HQU51537.1 MBL fold metallo-hydrolase [Saprospiraceae bacterium]
MELKICGAAQEVTGSAHLITLESGLKVLLDCGMFQGSEYEHLNEKWYFNPEEIDVLILSHAHIDHSGRIPKLVKDGFKGPIVCTHATRSLCAIMLLDSAKIQMSDAEYYNRKMASAIAHGRRKNNEKLSYREPMYTDEHVHMAMDRFISFGYDQWYPVSKEVEVIFTDAGHILGSASVTLRIKDGEREIRLGFTGDIGRPNRPILRDPQIMPPVDYLISESTYGDRLHDFAPNEESRFLDVIKHTCLDKKGKLIIPAFSVGRTQEIVYMLDQMENAGVLPPIPVYVDSPLAVNATTVFGIHPECYDEELSTYLLTDPNPFGFNRLHYIQDVNESKALNNSKEPCIIISSAGMLNAGRSKHHLFNNIDNPKNTFLMVGYCTPETPGGKLRAGARTITLFGEQKEVNAEIQIMDSFSAHGDRDEMTAFLKPLLPGLQRLFLVHGDLDAQKAFKSHLQHEGFGRIEIPSLGQNYYL